MSAVVPFRKVRLTAVMFAVTPPVSRTWTTVRYTEPPSPARSPTTLVDATTNVACVAGDGVGLVGDEEDLPQPLAATAPITTASNTLTAGGIFPASSDTLARLLPLVTRRV